MVLASGSGGHEYLYGLFFSHLGFGHWGCQPDFLQKIPLPFTVLLLLIGLGMGALNRAYIEGDGHGHSASHAEQASGLWAKFIDTLSGAITWGGNLDGHLILYVFLPILIFEAGFALDVHTFKKSFLNAFYLAGPGIITATVLSGLIFYGMIGVVFGGEACFEDWNVDSGAFVFLASMLFGAVVSATDPVAVVALLKELGASKKAWYIDRRGVSSQRRYRHCWLCSLIGVVTGAEAFTWHRCFYWKCSSRFSENRCGWWTFRGIAWFGCSLCG